MFIMSRKKSIYTFNVRHVLPATMLASCLMLQGCYDGAPKLKDATEQTVYVTSNGVETEVNEVEPGDVFKITDERILDSKEASRAIIHNLDQSVDTMSMASLKGDATDPRRSALRSTLMGGLAFAYFSNRAGNIAPKSSSYASTSAYNKSNGMTSSLKNSATPRKVSIPGKTSRGYGAGKSFRSFGG